MHLFQASEGFSSKQTTILLLTSILYPEFRINQLKLTSFENIWKSFTVAQKRIRGLVADLTMKGIFRSPGRLVRPFLRKVRKLPLQIKFGHRDLLVIMMWWWRAWWQWLGNIKGASFLLSKKANIISWGEHPSWELEDLDNCQPFLHQSSMLVGYNKIIAVIVVIMIHFHNDLH